MHQNQQKANVVVVLISFTAIKDHRNDGYSGNLNQQKQKQLPVFRKLFVICNQKDKKGYRKSDNKAYEEKC